jgi:hypothetical protein
MVTVLTAALIGLASIVGGFITSLVVIGYFKRLYDSRSDKEQELFQDYLATDRQLFTMSLASLFKDIMAHVKEAQTKGEEELQEQLIEVNAQINRSREQSEEAHEQTLAEINEHLKTNVQKAKEQYAHLEKMFREKMSEEPTLHLITTAYAVASKNLQPRDIVDGQLAEAVRAHQKSGAASIPKLNLKKVPGDGGLN